MNILYFHLFNLVISIKKPDKLNKNIASMSWVGITFDVVVINFIPIQESVSIP